MSCSRNSVPIIKSFFWSFSSSMTLRRRKSETIRNIAFTHKIDYVALVQDLLNLKVHLKSIIAIGSKVTEILLNAGILRIGGVASEWSCDQLCYLV